MARLSSVRTCGKCKATKPLLEGFDRAINCPAGYRTTCQECRGRAGVDPSADRTCLLCLVSKKSWAFSSHGGRYHVVCKTCASTLADEGLKSCSVCATPLPLPAHGKTCGPCKYTNRTVGGRSPELKDYHRQVSRQYYRDHRELVLAKAREKYRVNPTAASARPAETRSEKLCSRCGHSLPVENFCRRSGGQFGAYCKPCNRAHAREWRSANLEKANALAERSRNHPDAWFRRKAYTATAKAKKVGVKSTLTPKDVKRLFGLYRGLCAYCARAADQIDHVIPLARSGANTVGNVLPCCGGCNSSKHTSLLVEWRAHSVGAGRSRLHELAA